MLPVSVLPLAGILLGVGSAHLGGIHPLLGQVAAGAGGCIFEAMPLLFAVGVALGLSEFEGVAAVAASVGFFCMLSTLGVLGHYRGLQLKPVTGIDTLDTGVFGGIMVGLLAGWLYRRFYRLELPAYLGFFAGKRSVPILTGLASVFLGLLLSFLWPPLQAQIQLGADQVAQRNPVASMALWGLVNRALIPFGLHHIWNNPFFFQIGSFLDPHSGQVVHGDIQRFLKGDPSAGLMGGGYLFSLWGLPAAALAMVHCAPAHRRKEIAGLMSSAALTSILTGITEPIEFTFLFVAPALYLMHAVLAGLACGLMLWQGGHLGFTFSFGLIDYILLFPLHTRPELVVALGPGFAITYYLLFCWAIRKFDLKTPGREESPLQAALGGRGNVLEWQVCAHSRLRVRLKCEDQIHLEALARSGVRAWQALPGRVFHLILEPSALSGQTDDPYRGS